MDTRAFEASCLLSPFPEEECLDFPEFQQHLMIMLNELQEKRVRNKLNKQCVSNLISLIFLDFSD